MQILMIHQCFPGQFKFLAPALVKRGHKVVGMTLQDVKAGTVWEGVEIVPYKLFRSSTPQIHPWIRDFETQVIRADACYHKCLEMRSQGFFPDCIVAHPGWGESMFLKEIWPKAKLDVYCEFYYHAHDIDIGFDPEFPVTDATDPCRIYIKNINNVIHLEMADAGIAPTYWQASTYPELFRQKIAVIHEGIDTDILIPNPEVSLTLNNTIKVTKADEVITFVNRNLEPYRGYHVFIRSLPKLLQQRPNARVLIVGGDSVSYGKPPEGNKCWRDIFADEVRPKISDADWQRIHFLGNIPYQYFVPLLQLSTVHVYLTYPFILSWSVLEAMSCGCAIVASDTEPLREVIRHKETGLLVPFFDQDKLISSICELLDNPAERKELGTNARAYAKEHYDLHRVCLPKQIEWVEALGEGSLENMHNQGMAV